MPPVAPSDPSAWSSLAHQLRLAERLYGVGGENKLSRWLDQQIDRIGNAEFARLFSDHIDLPGVTSLDYAHRFVRTSGGSLIGGIRFYGHDVDRPFVEVIAHSFPMETDGLHDALTETVAREWSAFKPLHMRLRVPPDDAIPPGSNIDTHVFIGRYGEMSEPDSRVRLETFDGPDEAMAMVRDRFGAMERDAPRLRRNVSPIEPDYLAELHGKGCVHAIVPMTESTATSANEPVGLLAVAPGGVDWIEGDEVMEEVVAVEHAGHGYAASAQRNFAARPSNDRKALLVGTIDALNVPSGRTAERAGRVCVMNYLFVNLPRVA